MLRQVRDRLQLDRPLAFALATRTWQVLSGPITIVLLIRALSVPEQGVYYSLIAIIGIQAFFELGLLNVLVSYSGHEFAAMEKARAKQEAGLAGNDEWLRSAARMRDFMRGAFRWFGVAGVLYAVSAIAFGYFALSGSTVHWQSPLLALVPIAAVSVGLAPAFSILEGAGCRELIYRIRLFQAVAGSIAVWLTLAMGGKLWALVASSLIQSGMAVYITCIAQAPFFSTFRSLPDQTPDFSWTRDVVPVQWRIALIGITFHFATQFFSVIVLMFHSDAEAGPLGMTLNATSAMQMFALAWVQTKFSIVAAHHGAGEREIAGTIWRRTAVVSTTLLIMASLALTAVIACLPLLQRGWEQRFLPTWQVVVLCIGCLSNHIAAVQGFYVLSRRARPLLGASLVGSLSTAASVWIGGYFYASAGVVTGYALAMTVLFLPVHTWAYHRFRLKGDS